MSKHADTAPLSLVQIATKLRDDDLDAALAAYREPALARLRVYGIAIAAAWAVLWYLLGPSEVPRTPRFWNYPQAVSVLPYVLTMLPLAAAWWLGIKARWIRPLPWVDAFGAAANMLGVALLLYRAFDLMIAFICYLPMISITVGARFRRPVFYGTIVVSAIIVQIAAPDPQYWTNRPHFALFAITLLVLMPLSVVRLLNTVRAVSDVALKSRDAQSRFVATMSHEFRTPLNSVINNAVLIDVDDMPESQKRIVDALTSAAMALRHRVNEVLDVRAIEAGALTVVADEPFRISSLLKTIRDVAEPTALSKNIEFSVDAGDVAELVMQSDPARLEQVITNLVTNAVKFTPEGGSVEVRACRDGPQVDGRVPIRFTISDTGPGIPEDEREKVWLPFHQVSSGHARRHGGVGLGLFLVKSILSYLGGTIDYTPRPGGGSVFTVRLALTRAAPGVTPTPNLSFKEAADEHRRGTRSMRCLVIDDAPSNLETIGRLLTIAGHTMVGASDGQEGIAKAKQEHFDLILLDLHMPDLTGYDVLAALKVEGVIPTTPVYMLSADASPKAIRDTQGEGARGYLTKPISYIKLLALLETVADGATRPSSPLQVDEPLTGIAFIHETAGETAAKAFARMCLTELESEIRSLHDVFEQQRYEDAAFCAHSLKNVFLNIGGGEGARACEDLRAELKHRDRGAAAAAVKRIATLVESTRARLSSELN